MFFMKWFCDEVDESEQDVIIIIVFFLLYIVSKSFMT